MICTKYELEDRSYHTIEFHEAEWLRRVNDLERKLAICREALMEAAEALHGCAIPAGGCDDAMVLLDASNHIEAAIAATEEET